MGEDTLLADQCAILSNSWILKLARGSFSSPEGDRRRFAVLFLSSNVKEGEYL